MQQAASFAGRLLHPSPLVYLFRMLHACSILNGWYHVKYGT